MSDGVQRNPVNQFLSAEIAISAFKFLMMVGAEQQAFGHAT